MRDLLITIAHHSAPGRLQYLRRMLGEFARYELSHDILIDTNVAGLDVRGDNVQTVHHDSLAHAFHLTWQHRKHMRARIDRYRWLLYLEDDLLLPFSNFQRYQENFALLWPKYVPSFLRVETLEGVEFALDVTDRQQLKPIQVGERTFTILSQPYHACWCMSQAALRECITPEFDRVSESREVAASFPMWELNKTPLLQIEGNQVSKKCLVSHLPNNYVSCSTSPHAKIKVEDAFF